MATLDALLERKKEVSGQVSSQTRAMALGMLATSWALLTSHDDPLKTMTAHTSHKATLIVGVLSLLVLVADLLQYRCAVTVAQRAIETAEASSAKEAMYENDSCAYKMQAFLYHAKFYILAGAGVILIYVIIQLLMSPAWDPIVHQTAGSVLK